MFVSETRGIIKAKTTERTSRHVVDVCGVSDSNTTRIVQIIYSPWQVRHDGGDWVVCRQGRDIYRVLVTHGADHVRSQGMFNTDESGRVVTRAELVPFCGTEIPDVVKGVYGSVTGKGADPILSKAWTKSE
jgi:hypothetical protein